MKIKNKFYVTSIGYSVLGDELDQCLCEYDSKIAFVRPEIQRAWSELLFDSELDALTALRELYPNRLLTVFEDTGKVVSTFGHESGLTTMVIRKESNQ